MDLSDSGIFFQIFSFATTKLCHGFCGFLFAYWYAKLLKKKIFKLKNSETFEDMFLLSYWLLSSQLSCKMELKKIESRNSAFGLNGDLL